MVRLMSFVSLALVGAMLAPDVSASGREPGSVLVYPVHASGRGAFTIINVTNTNLKPANPMSLGGSTDIKFEYVNVQRNKMDRFCPDGCLVMDKVEVLTPADTLSVMTGCHNADGFLPRYEDGMEPSRNGSEGYLVITALNPYGGSAYSAAGVPWSHNFLVGSEIVITSSGISYSINALPFKAMTPEGSETDLNGNRQRDFDGLEYEGTPDDLIIDSFLGISDSYLAIINLTGQFNDTNTLLFTVWNDNERAMSITRPFKCWFNQKLSRVSHLFGYDYLYYTDNDMRELDIDCDTKGDLETGWAIIESLGVRAPGGAVVDTDGAFLGSLSAGYESKISGGRLLWERSVEGPQTNGSFGPR